MGKPQKLRFTISKFIIDKIMFCGSKYNSIKQFAASEFDMHRCRFCSGFQCYKGVLNLVNEITSIMWWLTNCSYSGTMSLGFL